MPVSIHAPAWGATKGILQVLQFGLSFNPRARVGRDRWMRRDRAIHARFNPRARVGRDLASLRARTRTYRVSIHAPAWGATPLSKRLAPLVLSFNPRARVGRDTTE